MSLRTAAKIYLVLLPLHLCVALAVRGRTPEDTPFFAEFSDVENERVKAYVEPMAASADLSRYPGREDALRRVCELWRREQRLGHLKTIVPLEIGGRSEMSPVDEINQAVGMLVRRVESAVARAESQGDFDRAAEWALMGMEIAEINRESSYTTLRRSFDIEARFAPMLVRFVPRMEEGRRQAYALKVSQLVARKTDLSTVALRMGLGQSKQLMAEGDFDKRERVVRSYRALSAATATYDIDGLMSIAHGGTASDAALEVRLAANTAKTALLAKANRDRIVESARRQLMASLPSASS